MNVMRECRRHDSSATGLSCAPVVCGMIGYGALARQLVTAFPRGEVEWVIWARRPVSEQLPHIRFVRRCDDVLAARPTLVVEAASQQAVGEHLPSFLKAGIPAIIASVGALADPAIAARLQTARPSSETGLAGARFIIPSGAIGGLDYLEAIRILPDISVSYTSRKPVAAWQQELAKRGIETPLEEIILFEGTPEQAAQLYPQNLNAAFAIALTIHPAPLTVRVIADPQAGGNIHEIEGRSAAGQASFRFENAPSLDNPKSSMVTSLSLAASMRNLLKTLEGTSW